MKPYMYAALAAATLATATTSSAIDAVPMPRASASQTTVEFLEPEHFTDFRISQIGGERQQASLEKVMRAKVVELAQANLPEGYHLHLRFRDIDMAGDFEPWNAPNYDDVRIVRDIYPPRLHVEYSVTNASGEVVASGERRLIDMNHLNRVRTDRNGVLTYETTLLDDFIRDIGRSVS